MPSTGHSSTLHVYVFRNGEKLKKFVTHIFSKTDPTELFRCLEFAWDDVMQWQKIVLKTTAKGGQTWTYDNVHSIQSWQGFVDTVQEEMLSYHKDRTIHFKCIMTLKPVASTDKHKDKDRHENDPEMQQLLNDLRQVCNQHNKTRKK